MTSFQIMIEPKRRAAARFISRVRRALQKALVEEEKKSGVTQSEIARKLGVHRSVISRELKGYSDITLGRVGELAWAMGRRPVFELQEVDTISMSNSDGYRVVLSKSTPIIVSTGTHIASGDVAPVAGNMIVGSKIPKYGNFVAGSTASFHEGFKFAPNLSSVAA